DRRARHRVLATAITYSTNFTTILESNSAPPGLAHLYSDFYLSRSDYRYARPSVNSSEPVVMYMNVSLTQIMDVDEKNQLIKLNMWIVQEWKDPFFEWNPAEYGDADHMLLPPDALWTPDIVLYSNTGGDWDLSQSATKLKVYHDGRVVWKPPVIYESSCDINVEFFPFDTQECRLKMGTWTYHGLLIDLRHLAQKTEDERVKRTSFDNCEADINYAADLSEYVENTEWDLLQVSATRNIAFYACCPEPYLDITFFIRFRRQPVFYGTNLICPCMAISFLTVFVFYLPSDSQEKITLSISILIALTVFILLVFELTPPTSLVVPLITKYLLFTMILVSLSILVSTVVLNVRYRSPDANRVPLWAKRLFMHTLPTSLVVPLITKYLLFTMILVSLSILVSTVVLNVRYRSPDANRVPLWAKRLFMHTLPRAALLDRVDDLQKQEQQRLRTRLQREGDASCGDSESDSDEQSNDDGYFEGSVEAGRYGSETSSTSNAAINARDIARALRGVRSIARKIRDDIASESSEEEWKYVALVLDRLFLYCFGLSATVGTFGIFLQAPAIADTAAPMRREFVTEYERNISVVRRCGLAYSSR
uniref:Neur_chan_LBD domain-containing protein n=1 Tax=Macrostomum lignano TaxID=282301 RepID=A0A1I8GMR6_9PLAT